MSVRAMPPWQIPFAFRPHLVTSDLLIGRWGCDGHPMPPSREATPYFTVDVLHHGVHVRTVGRARHVIDPWRAAANAPGDEYLFASPSRAPQRGTFICLRGAATEALHAGAVGRSVVLSPRQVRAAARLATSAEPLELEETALGLARDLLQANGRRPPPHPSLAASRLAERVAEVVAERFRSKLTLSEIAAECGVTSFHAGRVFRAVMGQSIHQYLTGVRLRVALVELRRRQLTEVALAVGFSSHSHFSHAFRRAFDCTPSTFSKHVRD